MLDRKAPLPTRPRFESTDSPVLGPAILKWRWVMTFVPIMWTLWGVIVASMLLLHVYRSSLEKNEDDQIFLDDSFEHERAAQVAIVAKVHKVEPALRILKWLAVAMTVVVLVYYLRDIMMQLNIIR
jgi:hypothetical protein